MLKAIQNVKPGDLIRWRWTDNSSYTFIGIVREITPFYCRIQSLRGDANGMNDVIACKVAWWKKPSLFTRLFY